MSLPTQAEVLEWVAARWPDMTTTEWRAIKVGEESGEVLGAVIKAALGLKPRSEIGVEAAQTVLCLMALAAAEGFDLWAGGCHRVGRLRDARVVPVVTTAGRAHTKPWRVTWYMRDPDTGKPSGGGRRAFVLEASAQAHYDAMRALGYSAECWREDTLPGVG